MSRKPEGSHLILSISDNCNSHRKCQICQLLFLIPDFTSEGQTQNNQDLIISKVLAMGAPGPGVDHTDSASSHFMFVKRKDETAKEGLLCFFVNILQT